MTCHDVIMASQTRHFEFEAAILDPDPAVIQLTGQGCELSWRPDGSCKLLNTMAGLRLNLR